MTKVTYSKPKIVKISDVAYGACSPHGLANIGVCSGGTSPVGGGCHGGILPLMVCLGGDTPGST